MKGNILFMVLMFLNIISPSKKVKVEVKSFIRVNEHMLKVHSSKEYGYLNLLMNGDFLSRI